MIAVEMLAAGNGDALLVEYGDPGDLRRILIDGGPWNCYESLRAGISALAPDARRFELLVVTHIDADHIDGIVRLLADDALGASFEQVWFNGYKHLGGTLAPKMGELLSGMIAARRVPWNVSFDGDAVAVSDHGVIPTLELPGGAHCTLLSPMARNLKRLAVVWETDPDIRDAGVVPGTQEAARRLAETDRRFDPLQQLLGSSSVLDVSRLGAVPFRADTSPTNASSIAFLLEYAGQRCFFGADATPSVLVPAVRRLLDQRGVAQLTLDGFKVPHHGSRGNVSCELLKLLPARRYLFSTDGARHGHPDPESGARVVAATRAPALVFNYRTAFNGAWDDEALMEAHGYAVAYPPHGQAGIRVDLEPSAASAPTSVPEAHGHP